MKCAMRTVFEQLKLLTHLQKLSSGNKTAYHNKRKLIFLANYPASFYSKQFFPKLISPRQGRPSCERVQFQSRAEMLFVPLHIFCNKTTTLLTSSLTMQFYRTAIIPPVVYDVVELVANLYYFHCRNLSGLFKVLSAKITKVGAF